MKNRRTVKIPSNEYAGSQMLAQSNPSEKEKSTPNVTKISNFKNSNGISIGFFLQELFNQQHTRVRADDQLH